MKNNKSSAHLFTILSLVLLLFACGDEDPYETVECLNGGVCLEGICDCPENYSGVNCETCRPIIKF